MYILNILFCKCHHTSNFLFLFHSSKEMVKIDDFHIKTIIIYIISNESVNTLVTSVLLTLTALLRIPVVHLIGY